MNWDRTCVFTAWIKMNVKKKKSNKSKILIGGCIIISIGNLSDKQQRAAVAVGREEEEIIFNWNTCILVTPRQAKK